MLGVVNLAAEQRDARAVFLCIVDQAESVIGRAGAAAKNTDDDVWVEDLKEIAELLQLSLLAELLEGEQRLAVLVEVVNERDGVEAEVGAGKLDGGAVALDLAALDLLNGRRAERLGRLPGV